MTIVEGLERRVDSESKVSYRPLLVGKPVPFVKRGYSYFESSIRRLKSRYMPEAKGFINNFWYNRTQDFIRQKKRRKKAYPLMRQLSVELRERLPKVLKGSSLRRFVEEYKAREQLFWVKIFNKADLMGSLLSDFSRRYRDLSFLVLYSGDKYVGVMLKKPTLNDLKELYKKQKGKEKDKKLSDEISELLRGDLTELKLVAAKEGIDEQAFIRHKTEGAKYPGDLESIMVGIGFSDTPQLSDFTEKGKLDYIFNQFYELFNKSNSSVIEGYNYPLWNRVKGIVGLGVMSIDDFLNKFSDYCIRREREVNL